MVKALAQGGFTDVAHYMLKHPESQTDRGPSALPPPLSSATDRCYQPSTTLTIMPVRQRAIAAGRTLGREIKNIPMRLDPNEID